MRTLAIGRELEHFGSLDSTNSEMLRRLKEDAPTEGKLILADRQTEGRGQRGAHWESEEGSDLTFSFLLYPKRLVPEEQFDLSRAVTLGIAEAVMYLQPSINDLIRVKWPNDVLIGDEKLAGVLIENNLQGERISSSVVGIGFDLRCTEREERLGHTSLESATGLIVDSYDMLERICKGVESRYFQMNDGDVKGIRENFNQRCYLFGQWGTFQKDRERFVARVREVDPHGHLVIEHRNGQEARYAVKELSFLGPAP